ncbi:hypothetical protein J7T55_004480 [Diaporthe amygdali]|uniref:uncharacterized protein n=1 Tax=Phomopsis amygdali TaxID=1214568 RepID=UPI0022FE2E0F|nr:uncharacterized protein J7T55_004480 [Diaporthe amygdali]KAJ0114739.1 hypothetical protein J7T55_004480 [Diaporthe amygdali]
MTSRRADTDAMSQTAVIRGNNDHIQSSRDTHEGQPVRYASAQEWAEHKEEIRHLYMEEEMPLQQVITVMKENYNFHATAKMYKTRLRFWGFRKNISLRDGLDSDAVHRALSDNHRGPVRLPNGQVVDSSRLATHMRRRLQGRGALARQGTTQMPHLQAVRPPNTFYISEAVLFSVRSYIMGLYQGTVTTGEALDELRWSNAGAKWSRFAYAVKAALSEDKFNQALVLMRQAPEEIRLLIQDQPANLLSQLLLFIVHATRRQFSDEAQRTQFLIVVRSLINYGESVAAHNPALRLPPNQPLRQLLRALSQSNLEKNDLNQLATQAWRLSLSTWDDMVPESTTALGEWMNFSNVGGLSGLPTNFGTRIEQSLASLEARYGERDERCIKTLRLKAEYILTVDDDRGINEMLDDRVRDIFVEVLRRGAEGVPRLVAYRYIADYHRERGEQELAEENLRSSIDVMRENFGESDLMVLTYVSNLETWLTEWGKTEKAAQAGRWREELQIAADKKAREDSDQ